MSDLTPKQFLTDFLLEKIGDQPVERRIALYRALAVETADKQLADSCREIAGELDEIQRQHVQLQLDFRARAQRHN